MPETLLIAGGALLVLNFIVVPLFGFAITRRRREAQRWAVVFGRGAQARRRRGRRSRAA